jgi:hypothetical protein
MIAIMNQDLLPLHAGDCRRCPGDLARHRQTLLQVMFLLWLRVPAWRRRVETDATFPILAILLGVCVSAASDATGCATDRLPDVPLMFLCEPP